GNTVNNKNVLDVGFKMGTILISCSRQVVSHLRHSRDVKISRDERKWGIDVHRSCSSNESGSEGGDHGRGQRGQ
ncbi:hypothetical protein PENTCL1PPCAC_3224, partial [Pristionchus entomophagus]